MKHVREAIAPVQNQANKTHDQVGALQNQADANKQVIGALDREVAIASEKATDAGKKASEAAEAAAEANAAATEANRTADAANSLAHQVQKVLNRSLQNLNNYKLVATEQVFFGINRSSFGKETYEKLDRVIGKLSEMKNYIVEVAGYADSSGGKAYNRELGRKRANAVVDYLVVQHNIPMRAIRELGVGSEFPDADNRTSEARHANRRVELRVYQRDLGGQ